jgi:hypothetical protein
MKDAFASQPAQLKLIDMAGQGYSPQRRHM